MSLEDLTVKVLDLNWTPNEDSLSFGFSSIILVFTKLGVLSAIDRIFDPLGFFNPVVLFAKHLMQSIWSSFIAWDDKLPLEIEEELSQLNSELPSLLVFLILLEPEVDPRICYVDFATLRFVGKQLSFIYALYFPAIG